MQQSDGQVNLATLTTQILVVNQAYGKSCYAWLQSGGYTKNEPLTIDIDYLEIQDVNISSIMIKKDTAN